MSGVAPAAESAEEWAARQVEEGGPPPAELATLAWSILRSVAVVAAAVEGARAASVMATRSRRRTRAGWVRCPVCQTQFLREHTCRASRPLVVVDRRPDGFEQLVADALAESRVEAAAGDQLSLDDAQAASCRRCGPLKPGVHVDEESGLCTPCMRERAFALAGRAPP